MISTFTVVFDADVLFSTRLTSLLMWLSMSGLFRARWSEDIHREWIKAVNETYGIKIEDLEERKKQMDAAVPDCLVTGYEDLIDGLHLPDKNDRHVLAAAIRCGANAIVTFNEKDFPSSELDKYGIHTRHPDEFLLEVKDLPGGSALVEAAKRDWLHYQNPKLTLEQYLGGLAESRIPETAKYLARVEVLLTS